MAAGSGVCPGSNPIPNVAECRNGSSQTRGEATRAWLGWHPKYERAVTNPRIEDHRIEIRPPNEARSPRPEIAPERTGCTARYRRPRPVRSIDG